MAAPTITTIINDGRGTIPHGINYARSYATSSGIDQWADATLIDISTLFSSLKPLGLKIKSIYARLSGSFSTVFEFDHIGSDKHIFTAEELASEGREFKIDFCNYPNGGIKDDISELLDGCETAWTAKTNVTVTDETTIIVTGSKSQKISPAAAFTTGLLATYDFSAVDCQGYHGVGFFIRPSINLQPGDLSLVIDETSACASPSETIVIPALTANKWSNIKGNFVNALADRNAIISVGLQANRDFGACDIYVDSIRVQKRKGYEMSAVGDVVITSAGIAASDTFYSQVAFECLWAEDKIK